MIGLLSLILFVFIFLGFPVAMAMGCASMIGIWIDPAVDALVVAQKIFVANDAFTLMAVPLFMLSGQIMEHTGIMNRLFDLAKSIVGWMRGGIAYTTILAGVLMAGISGSANADSAALASMTMPTLRKDGWDDGTAVCIVAAAGGLGPIIPPSIPMIVFCGLTNFSVGKMFMAGVMPGLILAIMFMVISGVYAKKHNMPRTKFLGFKHLAITFVKAIPALLAPVIILGGILTGICTATESAVLAVVYCSFLGFVTKRLTFKQLWECSLKAVKAAAGPMAIISIGAILGYQLTRYNLAAMISGFVHGISSSYIVFYLVLTVILVISGMFIDGTATMLMLVPVMLPIARSFGVPDLQFGIIFLMGLWAGGFTPPVGELLLIVSSIYNIPPGASVKPVIPFIAAFLLMILLIMFIPQIVTFIPGLLF